MREFQRQGEIVKQLAEENIQLKAKIDQVKVNYNGKFLKLKDLLGLDFMQSIDDVAKAEPHTQMMRELKKIKGYPQLEKDSSIVTAKASTKIRKRQCKQLSLHSGSIKPHQAAPRET